MKRFRVTKSGIWLTGIAMIISLVVISCLPKRFEDIFGHSLQEISRGSITVFRDDMHSKYFEIEPEDLKELISCFESLRLKPAKRVNYISHKNGFGFYLVVFADAESEVLEPVVRVDYSGSIYINNTQYRVTGDGHLISLLERMSEPRVTGA